MKTRKVEFIDKDVKEVLRKRGDVVKKGRVLNEQRDKLQKQINELDKELNVLGLKLGQYEDKIKPWVNKELIPLLGDTEDVSTVDVSNDKIVVEIYDKVEEYKEQVIKATQERREQAKSTKPIEGKVKTK
jgi:chromosome segregation ATPase